MLVFIILDGFGLAPDSPANAITLANTPNFDYLSKHSLITSLKTDGGAVGLPTGQMGNSEVGHLTIGSGRIIKQDLVRINNMFASNQLQSNVVWQQISGESKTVHLCGLMSDGGIHSQLSHLLKCAEQLANKKIMVKLHLFSDGRDTSPTSAVNFLQEVQQLCQQQSNIQIATICGRYYAMDRDNRYQRTKIATDSILHGCGEITDDFIGTINGYYQQGITDEFLKPLVARSYHGVNNDDSILFINFRADRMRQLTSALCDNSFSHYNIGQQPFWCG
ncbi:MAG: 2,3-bisphosphoglycerate-independent phosphoglycerate mutase, partial [Pseudomonadota bacterium]